MKIIRLLFINLIFSASFSVFSQEPVEYAKTLHNQLKTGDFSNAFSSMIQMRRKSLSKFSNPNIPTFINYLTLLGESGWIGDEKEEAELYADMLDFAYRDNPPVKVKKILQLIRNLNYHHTPTFAEIFYVKIRNLLPEKQQLETLYDIAWAYNYTGAPYKGWYKFRECVDGFKHLEGSELEYAESLKGIAFSSPYIGRQNEALKIYQDIAPIYERILGSNSFQYAINCDNIGKELLTIGDNPEIALPFMEKAYEIFKKIPYCDDHLAICINNMGMCYKKMGNTKKALELMAQSLELDSTASTVKGNIGRCYTEMHEFETALSYFDELSEFEKSANCASTIAQCYAGLGDFEASLEIEHKHLDFLRNQRKRDLEDMIGTDREQYFALAQDYDLDSLFSMCYHLGSPEAASLCYDYLLFKKSVSLSCDRSIESIVASSSDNIKRMYRDLVNAKRKANNDRSLYEDKERDFMRLLAKDNQFYSFLDLTHKDIVNKLKPNEVAIEFQVTRDNNLYAVILTSSNIKLLRLGMVTGDLEHNNIWEKLHQYTANASNIYFSPDGFLYTYPLEIHFKPNKAQRVYRLSSTRELVTQTQDKGRDAYIYGGLQYDVCLDTLKLDAKRYKNAARSLSRSFIINLIEPENEDIYLPGTLEEANAIVKYINNATYAKIGTPMLFTGDSGTEASFKDLSGNCPRVIHIGTHGYSFVDPDEPRPISSVIDTQLSQSGLLMSGAKTRGTAEEGLDDGILTAAEISMLDLRGLDLVSLSACETGLGKLSDDGVIGLQRGFKKAGANSLLMSLWKVDDDATSLLMSEFYRNWTSGTSKYDSFEKAKETVRSKKDRGWDNPYFWASFILLDGLD